MSSILALAVSATLAAAPVITLQDALVRARQENLDLKAAQARLAQAEQASGKAWSGYLPTLTASGAIIRNSVEASIPAIPGLSDEPSVIQPLIQKQGQIELKQAIIAPQLWAAIQGAYKAEEVAKLSTEQARREILFGVAQAYYGASAQAQAVLVQERLVELNKAREKDTKARFDAGTVTKVALLRSQLDLSRAEQDLVRARNGLQGAKLVLSTLLALENADFELAPPPEPQVAVETNPDALVDRALGQRADVASARENVNLQKINKKGVWFSYLPTLGVNAAWRINNAPGFTGRSDTWAITFGASWTLWDGGLREANLREASAKVAEATATARKAEFQTREDVKRAQLDLESALANRANAENALGLARETGRLTEVSFKAGVATYLEVADANTTLTNAEIGLVSERLNSSLAALRLLRSMGAFEARPLTELDKDAPPTPELVQKAQAPATQQPATQQPAQEQPAPAPQQ